MSVTPSKGCNLSHQSTRRILIKPEDNGRNNPEDTFQVFVRVKPNLEVKRSVSCMKVEDDSTLICHPPPSSKNKKKEKVEYKFSHIFGPETSQTEIFSKCVINRVEELLNSKSGLIFTYGTTNSGKTYTVQGNAKNPGIIPQTLNAIFNNIEVSSRPLYKPNLEKMSPRANSRKDSFKNEILRSFRASCKPVHRLHSARTDAIALCDEKPRCGVWISFLEVYNETVNDLLNPRCAPRKIAADANDNFYVKELKQIYVSNAEEAYTVYLYGKKNLNMASNNLNENSSRSHCIFTIHLVNVNNERKPNVSKLRICDLAGSERLTKTQNTGLRGKETGHINTSLFQLNCCLRTIRENQTSGIKQLIPYRQSSLTKLLHSALDDRTNEKIIMIVNINTSAELYDETQQALKMCAIASKIKNKPLTRAFRRRSKRLNTSSAHNRSETASVVQDLTPLGDPPILARVSSKHSQDKPCDYKDAMNVMDRLKSIRDFYRTNILSTGREKTLTGETQRDEENTNGVRKEAIELDGKNYHPSGNCVFEDDNNNNVSEGKSESLCCLEKTADVRECVTNPEIYMEEVVVDRSDNDFEVVVLNLSTFVNEEKSRASAVRLVQSEAVTQEEDYQSQVKKTKMLELRFTNLRFALKKTTNGMRQHYYEVHLNALKKRNIYCRACGRFYASSSSLSQHTTRHCALAKLLVKAGPNGPKEYVEFFKDLNEDQKIRSRWLETHHVSVVHPFIRNFAALDEATLLSWVPIVEPIKVHHRRRSTGRNIKRSRQMRIDQYFFRESQSPETSSRAPKMTKHMDSGNNDDGDVNVA